MCLLNKTMSGSPSNHMFAVEFDTWLNPEFDDPSNNHIGVNINSMKSAQTYDFCANKSGYGSIDCNHFNTGRDFTSWIDYNGTNRKLEVRLANGSSIDGVEKPSHPLLTMSNLDLSGVFDNDMYVGFSGSVGLFGEVHEIKAWSFQSSLLVSDSENIIRFSRAALIAGAMAVAGVFIMVVSIGLLCLLKKMKEKEIEEKELEIEKRNRKKN